MKVSILHIVGSLHIKRHIFYLPDSIVILIVHDLKLSSGWRRFNPRHWNTFQKIQQLTIMQISNIYGVAYMRILCIFCITNMKFAPTPTQLHVPYDYGFTIT